MLMKMVLVFLLIGVGALALAKECGDFDSYKGMLRQTFAPRGWHEFWYPACIFCWVARIALLIIVMMIAVEL